jgi:serine protease
MRKMRIFCLLVGLVPALALVCGLSVVPASAREGAAVHITSPNYDSTHVAGDTIVFTSNAKSAGGPDIPKAKFVWTSQLDGKIGEGALLKISTLTVGIHRIMVEVSDDSGSLGTDSIKIKINATKAADEGTKPGAAPAGAGKGEQYVVNPFN